MEKEIFPVDGGFGYRIVTDGCVTSEQTFTPGASGFVLMTEAQANAFADEEIARAVSA